MKATAYDNSRISSKKSDGQWQEMNVWQGGPVQFVLSVLGLSKSSIRLSPVSRDCGSVSRGMALFSLQVQQKIFKRS